ncbi:isopenicillin N synthase family dioxygenase [Nostoc sp. DedQUE09]|uniref:isopenicillin N synthase family dioxygenase n=1 Tax=Nostoc sp. DedQUE09 TaxID=3075394 RepID=UPI002AD2007C|nr:2-oxoglutarate and iron-dependent oxygenase domain-containing protein [Nostoc sp. DedQUE09]MDZ7955756.1 2-oxoglutarate and iron-dependent oxygenase domain-containing protein [Nostoc sp. DedQUE09]
MVKIPVIDFTNFTKSNAITRQAVIKQIYEACHEIGFMYLQNSAISKELIKEVFNHSKSFFNLPLEVKQKQAWSDELSNMGYVGIERERLNPNKSGDLKEAFNVNKQAVGTNASLVTFYDNCTEFANRILQAYALALELPEYFFTIRHNQQNHTLRLLHYPPLQTPPKPGQVRAGEHSDYGSITLLFQDDIGGLEVQTVSGEWIVAPAIPDTVIVNTGDLMQRWTNHRFCSTKHRVMIPSDDRVNQSRYSMAFFCHPNDDTEITCLESCQKEQLPIYAPILAGEYLLSRLQATYGNS